jgi:hypothetical protein
VIEKFFLLITLTGMSPQGRIDVPVTMAFDSRQACMQHVDTQVRAFVQVVKPPHSMAIVRFCEGRLVQTAPGG